MIKKIKLGEYRKNIPNKEFKESYIYSTKSKNKRFDKISQKIILKATIKTIISESPQILWEKTHSIGGVNHDDFNSYFKECSVGFFIPFEKIQVFISPFDPYLEFQDFHPPQSFCYLKEEQIQKLEKYL